MQAVVFRWDNAWRFNDFAPRKLKPDVRGFLRMSEDVGGCDNPQKCSHFGCLGDSSLFGPNSVNSVCLSYIQLQRHNIIFSIRKN